MKHSKKKVSGPEKSHSVKFTQTMTPEQFEKLEAYRKEQGLLSVQELLRLRVVPEWWRAIEVLTIQSKVPRSSP